MPVYGSAETPGTTPEAAAASLLAEKVRFLSRGENLREPEAPVECIETHAAWVFMTERYAYKLRKPIVYHGIDTSTMRLVNSELTTGVYLRALPLLRTSAGKLRLGNLHNAGETVDWLVKMRRLRSERMLDMVAALEQLEMRDLDRLHDRLAQFYAGSTHILLGPSEYVARFASQAEEACATLRRARMASIAAPVLASVESRYHGALVLLRETLGTRAQQRKIRDCHGDLRPEHIWLGPPVHIIDRLDFDERLRHLDPLEEICFLQLECERQGFGGFGRLLLARALEEQQVHDQGRLCRFYLASRALCRAQLAAWRYEERADDSGEWAQRASYYLQRAMDALAFACA
jgi:aminoglycoside phosphotransferase family enzyme